MHKSPKYGSCRTTNTRIVLSPSPSLTTTQYLAQSTRIFGLAKPLWIRVWLSSAQVNTLSDEDRLRKMCIQSWRAYSAVIVSFSIYQDYRRHAGRVTDE